MVRLRRPCTRLAVEVSRPTLLWIGIGIRVRECIIRMGCGRIKGGLYSMVAVAFMRC